MVDYSSLLPVGLPADPTLLPTLLNLLPMGVIYYTPVVDAAGVLTDLGLAYLNPAAQRMTQLPARPNTTYRQYFLNTDENGAWDFHRRSWAAQGPQHFQFYYEAPGYNDYFRLTAQRLGQGLLVVFTHTRNEALTQTEAALNASQARERQAQAEAARQQQLLRQVFEHAPVPLALFQGLDYVVELANPALAALWGRPVAEVVGRPVFEALPDLRDQGFDEILAGVLRTGESFRAEEVPAVLAREHLGQPALGYFNISYQALRTPAGEPATTIIASAVEVTNQVLARRRIEQLIEEAEVARAAAERQRGELARVFEQAPLAIAVYQGPKYTIQLANPTVARLWGRTREQLIGKGLFEALPEVAGLGYEQLLDEVMATGVPHVAHAMKAQHAREGRLDTVYWDFVYVPTYAAEGHIDGAMVVATEVTSQVLARRQVEQLNQELEARVLARTQEAQQALAAAERERARFQAIIAQAPVAIGVFTGDELRLTALNPPMAALFGYPVEQLLGRPLPEALPELAGQGFEELMRQVLATQVPFVGKELPVTRTRAGQAQLTYYNLVYHPLYGADGHATGIIEVATDVTEQVRARQQVQQLNQELAAANEQLTATNAELHESNTRLTRTNADLDTFVYTASHDLKAPITDVEGLLLALREELPPAVQHAGPVAELLRHFTDTVARFRQTITQLTDLIRLQQAQGGPAEPVPLLALVAAVRCDLAADIAAAEAAVHVAVPAPLHVVIAVVNLRSVVYNLLSNAVKYRDPGRPAQVWVRAERQPGQVVLTVQDNGLGLTASQQQRLFQVFQRLHTHVEGTGVGLYMIKRLVENAGGTIAVHSEAGVGTTFQVTLPGH